VKCEQCFVDGLGHEFADLGLAVEFYFALGGVDVHVHGGGIEFEEQATDRVAALHQRGVVAFEQGVIDAAVLHRAAVDEHVLVLAGGARDAGRADETPDAELRFGIGDWGFQIGRPGGQGGFKTLGVVGRGIVGDRGGKVHLDQFHVTQEGAQALTDGGEPSGSIAADRLRGQLPDGAGVFQEGERHVRVRQRGEGEVMLDVRCLGLLGAEEFAAGGQVEEKLPHLDARAGGAAGGLDLGDLAATDEDPGALGGIAFAFAGGEREPAHAGDAGQRLAAKAHGGNGRQVLGLPDLAGGVALQREQRVVAAHAQTVVRHADEAASAGLDLHGDARGLGVEGILDEFLDDAGGTFDDLTRRDLVGDVVGQEFDAVHGRR
jgi:hypothetical protein